MWGVCHDNSIYSPGGPSGYLDGEDSPPLAIVTPQAFIPIVDVDTLPGIYAVPVPDPDDDEDTSNACSEEMGRAIAFRGSGRAIAFRGSGRAIAFRGSGNSHLINANTAGSEFDTVLVAFRVPVDEPFNEAHAQMITCNDNSAASTGEPRPVDGVERPPSSPSFMSNVSVPFDEDYDLYFMVFARNNESGQLIFTIDGQESTIPNTPLTQVAALGDLYSATNGSGWTTHTNWFENNNPCSWYGISCYMGLIQQINLPNNHLQGTLPASLSALTNLNTLNLQDNGLTGTVPEGLPTSLTILQLQNNALAGALTVSLKNLISMMVLNLSYNGLYSSDASNHSPIHAWKKDVHKELKNVTTQAGF